MNVQPPDKNLFVQKLRLFLVDVLKNDAVGGFADPDNLLAYGGICCFSVRCCCHLDGVQFDLDVVLNLRVLSDRYFNTRPIVVGKPDCKVPIDVRVDAGTAVGPDRIVNSVAGYDLFGGNLIIVDFGTATTFDVVDKDGAYVGGVIAPGVNLSLQALHQMAAALPHVDIARPKEVIGTNTVACMQSGVFWGYIGLVKEICRKIIEEKQEVMKIIATGGLAPLLQSSDQLFEAVEDNLTMHGLRLIFDCNKSVDS